MRYLILNFLLLSVLGLNAQIQTTHRQKLSGIPIYNKQTGAKLSDREFIELKREHRDLVLQPKINKYGEAEALYVDTEQTGRVNIRDTSLRLNSGEIFPSFVMKTYSGDILDSEKLKGKLILIHCQIFIKPPFFKENALNEVSELINNKQNKSNVEFILLTESEPSEIDKSFFHPNELKRIVPDARNFMIRYLVNSSPCNILIDTGSKLVSYYDAFEFEKLKNDISRIGFDK